RIATRMRNHRGSIFGRTYVSVTDNWDRDSLLHVANPIPIRVAAVTLFAGSGVHGDCVQAAAFSELSELEEYKFLLTPSGAELHGEGNLHCGANSFENPGNEGQIAEQARAPVALHYLLGGTAEVEVDHVEAEALDHGGGFAQCVRVGAEELGCDRMRVLVEVEVTLGFLVLGAEHSVGRGELGHHQAATIHLADEASEDSVGYAGHGGEHGGRSNRDSADGVAGGNASFGRSNAFYRIVPLLAHKPSLIYGFTNCRIFGLGVPPNS